MWFKSCKNPDFYLSAITLFVVFVEHATSASSIPDSGLEKKESDISGLNLLQLEDNNRFPRSVNKLGLSLELVRNVRVKRSGHGGRRGGRGRVREGDYEEQEMDNERARVGGRGGRRRERYRGGNDREEDMESREDEGPSRRRGPKPRYRQDMEDEEEESEEEDPPPPERRRKSKKRKSKKRKHKKKKEEGEEVQATEKENATTGLPVTKSSAEDETAKKTKSAGQKQVEAQSNPISGLAASVPFASKFPVPGGGMPGK